MRYRNHHGKPIVVTGRGNGPIDAFVRALDLDVIVMDYQEHAIGSGADARAACYVELRMAEQPALFGVGIDCNIVTASLLAVLSAINRQVTRVEAMPVAEAA